MNLLVKNKVILLFQHSTVSMLLTSNVDFIHLLFECFCIEFVLYVIFYKIKITILFSKLDNNGCSCVNRSLFNLLLENEVARFS